MADPRTERARALDEAMALVRDLQRGIGFQPAGVDARYDGATTALAQVLYCLDALRAAAPSVAPPLHASAPEGHKCADCTIDNEACPTCYAAWWKRRHPHVYLAASQPEPPSMWTRKEGHNRLRQLIAMVTHPAAMQRNVVLTPIEAQALAHLLDDGHPQSPEPPSEEPTQPAVLRWLRAHGWGVEADTVETGAKLVAAAAQGEAK